MSYDYGLIGAQDIERADEYRKRLHDESLDKSRRALLAMSEADCRRRGDLCIRIARGDPSVVEMQPGFLRVVEPQLDISRNDP